jgi:rRNA maturation endonuclease Nob1
MRYEKIRQQVEMISKGRVQCSICKRWYLKEHDTCPNCNTLQNQVNV